LTKVKGLDPAAIFPLVAAHTIAGIISFPLGGYLAKRFGERRMLMIYTLLAIPTAVLFVLPEARLPLFFGSLLLGFFPGSIWGIVPSYLSRRFTAEERSFGLGVAGAFNSVGNFAPTVISMLAVTWGLGGSMLAAMIAATTMLLVTVSFNTDRWIIVPEDRHEQLNKNFVSAKADAPI
jgi:MFS family permease